MSFPVGDTRPKDMRSPVPMKMPFPPGAHEKVWPYGTIPWAKPPDPRSVTPTSAPAYVAKRAPRGTGGHVLARCTFPHCDTRRGRSADGIRI
jgi:hypothetical protein